MSHGSPVRKEQGVQEDKEFKKMNIKEKYQRFLKWQQQPHQVKPLSTEEHDCATCQTHFTGNYCPRCGQPSSTSRYSAKKAFLLFLDVWGLGNRGMYHSIRDLFLRPGYMVRDYLSGMQGAYFPPFKMLFLVMTLSLIVNTGFNIEGRNNIEREIREFRVSNAKDFHQGLEASKEDGGSVAKQTAQKESAGKTKQTASKEKKTKEEQIDELVDEKIGEIAVYIHEWGKAHAVITQLIGLLILSIPLYLRFRHSPNILDMRFSELFVALTYIINVSTFTMAIIAFFCLENDTMDELCSLFFSVITLKQLSGYGWWRTIIKIVTSVLILIAVIFIVILIGFLIIAKWT